MNQVDWLLFDLNSFFASCEQQEKPELRGKPLAVVAMLTDSTSVLAASYEAKRFGIKTGTRVSDAKKMCPGIRFVKTSHRLYLDYHERILEAVEEIIPIHSVLSVDEVSCELTGSQKNLEKALSLSRKLKEHVQKKVGSCLTSSIGLGPNTMIAKIASDMMKPNGLTWITKEQIPEKLGPLSVRVVPGIGARMERHLNDRGVFKISDILKMTEAQNRALWGSIVGSRTSRALKGEPYIYEHGATKSISHQHVLPPDLRTPALAFEVALRLLNKASVRLRKNDYRCKRLSLYVRFVDSTTYENYIKFSETTDTGFLMRQLKALWTFTSRKPPLMISVVLSDLEVQGQQQMSFFDGDTSRREKAFAIADQINEKFGKDAVHVASISKVKNAKVGGIAFSRVPDKEEFD